MNDILLQKTVVEQLDRQLGIGPQILGAEIHHGVVKLVGHLLNTEVCDKARRVVEEIEGVRSVIVDIDFSPTGHSVKNGEKSISA